MSDSKWVNRNLRAGSLPRGQQEGLPAFRREHSRHKSSRRFLNADKRERRQHDKKVGTRLFVLGLLAVCMVVIAAAVVQIRKHSGTANAANWLDPMSPYAVDAGPDPIVHDPAGVVERFVAATTIEELAAICRDDDNSPEILAEHGAEALAWLEGHREWMPMHEAKANGLMFTVYGIAHVTERPRPIYVIQTPTGPRVDLGAFLAWSSESWDDLSTGRAVSASIVRAGVAQISYYNYRFTDDRVFRSYRLDPYGDGHSLYGYVVRGTPTAVALEKLVPAAGSFPLVLSLDEGERGSTRRQFKITRVIAAGWTVGPEMVEDHLSPLVNDPSLVTPVPVEAAQLRTRRDDD